MIDNQLDTRDWVIYKITSPIGRIYIGETSNWHSRQNNYKNHKTCHQVQKQRMLYFSLCKYGYEAHKLEVIDSFHSDSKYCSGKEIFWIRSFMSNICKYPEQNGLNLTDGGEGNLGWKRPEESRLEIIRKNTGRKRSEESRKKIALGKIGNKHCLGRKLSEKHKQILLEAVKRKKGSETFKKTCKERAARMNREQGKTIVYLDDFGNIIKEFDFLHEAASYFNVQKRTMSDYLKKKRTPKKITANLKFKSEL